MSEKHMSRRAFLKTMLAAGGALGVASFVPDKWVKPLAGSGVLPVHAQSSASEFASACQYTIVYNSYTWASPAAGQFLLQTIRFAPVLPVGTPVTVTVSDSNTPQLFSTNLVTTGTVTGDDGSGHSLVSNLDSTKIISVNATSGSQGWNLKLQVGGTACSVDVPMTGGYPYSSSSSTTTIVFP